MVISKETKTISENKIQRLEVLVEISKEQKYLLKNHSLHNSSKL